MRVKTQQRSRYITFYKKHNFTKHIILQKNNIFSKTNISKTQQFMKQHFRIHNILGKHNILRNTTFRKHNI